MHTDGTFVDEATEWLLMMKFAEENAVGGESRFLHIDDWQERGTFLDDLLSAQPFLYKAPGSKNVNACVERPVFFQSQFGLAISFIDQFAQPRNRGEARYLHALSTSMETSPATREVPLPVGDLVVLNNYFWLHGRAALEKNSASPRTDAPARELWKMNMTNPAAASGEKSLRAFIRSLLAKKWGYLTPTL